MNNAPRKRRGSQSSKSRSSHKRRRGSTSTSAMTSATELIELEESVEEEVVDLTCESYEPAVVDLTDLTHNDSVVIVEEHQGRRRNRRNTPRGSTHAASCILSSDDEDSRDNDIYLSGSRSSDLTSSHNTMSRTTVNVSCPICMDVYSEIVQSGRLIVSTKCGHIFCSQCLRDALKHATCCPTCRKKLTHKQYHPIYI